MRWNHNSGSSSNSLGKVSTDTDLRRPRLDVDSALVGRLREEVGPASAPLDDGRLTGLLLDPEGAADGVRDSFSGRSLDPVLLTDRPRPAEPAEPAESVDFLREISSGRPLPELEVFGDLFNAMIDPAPPSKAKAAPKTIPDFAEAMAHPSMAVGMVLNKEVKMKKAWWHSHARLKTAGTVMCDELCQIIKDQ
ncbi:hypothetical protein T484DRAFT_1877101 [Baffinella frigidus]|nr:hypothetical protein T484DRAFT_1877101 [Cryptophyta sp. CCMP2293]